MRLCVSVELFSALFMCWMININECSIILLVAMCFVCFSDADPFHVFFCVQVAGASEEYPVGRWSAVVASWSESSVQDRLFQQH